MIFPKKGEIWRVNLDPTMGAEIKKTRPAVIVSNDHNNRYALTITILPITDKGPEVFPFEVFLPRSTEGLSKDSKIKCQQIRTVDKSRLIKLLGRIEKQTFVLIEEAIRLHLGFF